MPNPHWAITQTVAPTAEPVTLAEVKQQLRVTIPDDDDLIASHLCAARELVSLWSRRALMPTQYLLTFDRFPLTPNRQFSPGNPSALTPVLQNTWPLDPSLWALIVPRSPLISVQSIQYADINNTLQTMPSQQYVVDNVSEPGRITNAAGSYWPAIAFVPNAVRVNFTAGYANASLVPARLKLGIKMLVSLFYDNPSWLGVKDLSDAPPAVKALVDSETVEYFW